MSSVDATSTKKSNAALKSQTPYQLRALILDYLSHHCYTRTAKAFIKDSTVTELDADGDEVEGNANSRSVTTLSESRLKQVEQRREIRELILDGKVDEAIERLNQHFPSVLADSRLHANDTPRSERYVSATSVDPSHLLLNLRILAFTEFCRTRPLKRPTKGSAVNATQSPDNGNPTQPSTPSDLADEGAEMSIEKQSTLISKARKLYALVETLATQSERDIYFKELRNVTGLMAYTVPEKSDVAKYLSFERREAVAEQINRAILHRCGLPFISEIELAARYTTALWSAAKQHGAKPRAGVMLPPVAPAAGTGSKGEKGEVAVEEVPDFNLKLFLESR